MNKKDSLGDRMKNSYENRTRIHLPRRTYTIIRLDGKAFHSYTRHLTRPYCAKFNSAMDETMQFLCKNIQGAKIGYTQSDEITILLTDFDKLTTDAFFDGNVQKITSVVASMAAAFFNQVGIRPVDDKLAFFDARVFTISDPAEVANNFIWRQQDCGRNSIQMLAQHYYSQKELNGKNIAAQQEMIFKAGDNWNNHPSGYRRGRVAVRNEYGDWEVFVPPIFTQDQEFLRKIIPVFNNG